MAEKNGFAQILDAIAGGLTKMRDGAVADPAKVVDGDSNAILPKPTTQEIGAGIIVWKWENDFAHVEGVLATNSNNQCSLEKGAYIVNVQFPQTEHCAYSMHNNTAEIVGKTLLSAWNWQHIWKLHAGDFLLEALGASPAVAAVNDDDMTSEVVAVEGQPTPVAPVNPEPQVEVETPLLPVPQYYGPSCDSANDDEYSLRHAKG